MIRVLRVIEYEYPNYDAYDRDRDRWTLVVQQNDRGFRMTSQVVRVQEVNNRRGKVQS
jgi:hypothetical protein